MKFRVCTYFIIFICMIFVTEVTHGTLQANRGEYEPFISNDCTHHPLCIVRQSKHYVNPASARSGIPPMFRGRNKPGNEGRGNRWKSNEANKTSNKSSSLANNRYKRENTNIPAPSTSNYERISDVNRNNDAPLPKIIHRLIRSQFGPNAEPREQGNTFVTAASTSSSTVPPVTL